jgi:hypothetical protein
VPTVTISSARVPHQVFILGVFFLYGLASLSLYDRIATNSLRAFPEPWGRAFVAGLTLGAGMVLWAALRDDLYAIVRFERTGHVILAGFFSVFAAWSIGITGWTGTAFWGTLLGMAGSSVWRLLQIRRFVTAAKKVGGA